MHALLGKITQISRQEETSEPTNAAPPLAIRFKAACVLPERTPVPAWLRDPVLTITRRVADAREIGYPGDSLVLSPEESARWLYPLTVTPAVAYGALPRTLGLCLRWWKEGKLPEYTLRANGRLHSGSFTRDGEGGVASIDTALFFDGEPRLPVTFEVTYEGLKIAATVLPENEPGYRRLALPEGERHRLENGWYAVEISGRSHGGAIGSLFEKGRGVEHFRAPENRIQREFVQGGHVDRLKIDTGWEWSDKLQEVAMTCAGSRREGAATRLSLEGIVDDGQGLRTSVAYTLFDDLPLLLLERSFQFHKGKGEESDGKEQREKPREPIDDLHAVGLGFQAAWQAERGGHTGSRVLYVDGQRFAVTRCAEVDEGIEFHHWRISDGWIAVEHPRRREWTLYLFDPLTAPHLGTWLGEQTITLEPFWPFLPARPQESVGYSLALTAGELCGAAVEGAWVACRTPRPGGGLRGAVIARLREGPAGVAAFTSGGETREAPLRQMMIPGVDRVSCATVEYSTGCMEQAFEVEVAGIPEKEIPVNVFNPRTFSTDWEVMVVDKLERCVGSEKLPAFAGILVRETGLPIQIDWNTLEFALGINTSFEQLWNRIRAVTDRASQLVRDFDLELFPAGAHPVEEMFNASHVHVGTIYDESRGIYLENQLLKYAPAFAALAANSPVAGRRRGEYKSYRVRHQAHGATRPSSARDPHLAQSTWGSDAGPKLYGAPTLEVRITDGASSRRLLAEFATFVAAYVHHRGGRVEECRLSAREYRDCMTNRWAAARYGLQAIFLWDGAARPVVEVLDEMLDACAPELQSLGTQRSELTLLTAMIEKRVCQADWVLGLAERYPDPYLLASVHAKLARHWNLFDEYLASARTLDPVPLLDEEAILAQHLATIGEGTHFYRSREAMSYPPPVADEILDLMVARGLVRREVTDQRGTLLSRTG